MSVYDSRPDTLKHIRRVEQLICELCYRTLCLGTVHDASKFDSPEKEWLDELPGKLEGLTYGSPEYRAQLRQYSDQVNHHYQNNPHHPEHFENGISGMTLMDIVEMFCDWKAAGERHNDGNMKRSIEINRERFKMSNELACIFENTRKALLW